MGVAVRNARGEPLAALSIAAIGERLGTARRKEAAAWLREAVAQVGKKLG